MNVSERTIADVATIQAIRALLARHGRGVDRADAATISQCYRPDATVDYGFFNGPASEFATLLATAGNESPTSLHRTGQSWISVNGREARGESYVIAYAPAVDGSGNGRQRLVCGRYLDRFTHEDGAWKIAHRRYVLDVAISRNGAFTPPPLAPLSAYYPSGGHRSADAGMALLARAKAALPIHPKENDMTDLSTGVSPELIDRAISTQQLATLTAAYCRGTDRTDAGLLKTLFHDDSVVMSGAFNGNGQDFAVAICEIIRTHFRQAFHSTANQWFEVDGDAAIGESYVIAATTMREGGASMLTGGRYIDRFARKDGVWKFSERHFVCDWVMEHPATEQEDPDIAALPLRGKQGIDDPVYAFWK